MKKTVFEEMWRIEQLIKSGDKGWGNVDEENKTLMQVKEKVRIWDLVYQETYAMWQKLNARTKVEESHRTQYHPKGAWDRVDEVQKAFSKQYG